MLNVSRFSHLCKNSNFVKFCFKPPSYVCTSQQHNFLTIRRNFYRKVYRYFFPAVSDMKLQDKVSSEYKLIYVASSLNYVVNGYRFVASVTAAGSAMVLVNELTGKTALYSYLWQPEYYFHFIIIISYIVGIFTCVHLVSKPYVYRIYYSESKNKYLAILMDKHPFASKTLELEPKSVVQVRHSDRHFLTLMREHMYKTADNKLLHFNHTKFENMFYYSNLVKDSDYK
ncbi:UNVERIFIED_CONTAM: hypothetical protein RMT77_013475 [Armadillidium vulgare]